MEEIKFPIEGVAACPHCGSTERLLAKAIGQLKKDGKVPKESFPNGAAIMHQLFDPAHTQILSTKIKIPVLIVCYDICGECKTMYCTRVELIEQEAQMQVQRQPPPTRRTPFSLQ